MGERGKSRLQRERFHVTYRLAGPEAEARARAEIICLEQTVEYPEEQVPPEVIRDGILGAVESFDRDDLSTTGAAYKARISYAAETAAGELPQLLNVIFGNISLLPGIRVIGLDLPPSMLRHFKGPRFGRPGLRDYLEVPGDRPLLCTALKPLGLPSGVLADLAYRCALGGIDIIKDDHGLTNQVFAPFEERVDACCKAVARANLERGGKSVYAANVTAPAGEIMTRARFAKSCGAGCLLIAPGITGLDEMRRLAADDAIGLPILSHPALQGSFVASGLSGVSHSVLFGQLNRLAGADGAVYPNFGGRFPFTRDDCRGIVEGATAFMGGIKQLYPCPGGGMSLEQVPELLDFYGNEVILLIGGGLSGTGCDFVETSSRFRSMVGRR